MTSKDVAVFDQWLECYATDEERAMPYERQVECHVLWLAGAEEFELANVPVELFGPEQ